MQLGQVMDISALTMKNLDMKKRIRIAGAGRNGHNFIPLVAQMQDSIGHFCGAKDKGDN